MENIDEKERLVLGLGSNNRSEQKTADPVVERGRWTDGQMDRWTKNEREGRPGNPGTVCLKTRNGSWIEEGSPCEDSIRETWMLFGVFPIPHEQ